MKMVTGKSRLGGCTIFKGSVCVLMGEENEVLCAVFEAFAVYF